MAPEPAPSCGLPSLTSIDGCIALPQGTRRPQPAPLPDRAFQSARCRDTAPLAPLRESKPCAAATLPTNFPADDPRQDAAKRGSANIQRTQPNQARPPLSPCSAANTPPRQRTGLARRVNSRIQRTSSCERLPDAVNRRTVPLALPPELVLVLHSGRRWRPTTAAQSVHCPNHPCKTGEGKILDKSMRSVRRRGPFIRIEGLASQAGVSPITGSLASMVTARYATPPGARDAHRCANSFRHPWIARMGPPGLEPGTKGL